MTEMPSTSPGVAAPSARRSFARYGLALLLVALFGGGVWYAFFHNAGVARPSVLDFVPEDAQLAVVVQPSQILRSRLVSETVPAQAIPLVLDRIKLSLLPLDLRKVEQIGFYWSPTYPGVPEERTYNSPFYNATIVVILNEGVNAAQEMEKIPWFNHQWKQLPVPNGIAWASKMLDVEKQDMPVEAFIAVYSPSPRVLIGGCRGRVMTAGQSNGGAASPLKELLSEADLSHEFIAAGTELNDFKMSSWMATALGPIQSMAASSMFVMLKDGLLQVGLSPGTQLIDLVMEGRDDAYAQQLEQQLEHGRTQFKLVTAMILPDSLSISAADSEALIAELEKGWKVTRDGNNVRLSVPHTEKLSEQIKTALQPAVRSAHAVAQRSQSRNNMHRMAMAAHSFSATYRQFPPGQNPKTDKRLMLGQPKQVSWQYDLLPYLDQTTLHTGIEPSLAWNDPVNQAAGATLVPGFLNPMLKADLVEGFAPTHYVGIGGLGENGPNEPVSSPKAGAFGYQRATNMRDIKDGISNTFMAAEAASDFGPWIANTKATIRPFTKKPYLNGPDGIGGPDKEGPTQFMMFDGSVRAMSSATDPAIIEAMTTISGGERDSVPSRIRKLFKR